MKKKAQKKRVRRYTVSLSESEVRRLTRYADSEGIDRPTALHRLLSHGLHQVDDTAPQAVSPGQLGLFDSIQIDIFNNTHKVL